MVLGTAATTGKKSKKNGRKADHKQPILSVIVLAASRPTQGSGFGCSGASSSKSVGHGFITTNSFGHRTTRQEILRTTAIQVRQQQDQVEYQLNNESFTIDEHTQLARIRADENLSDQDDFSYLDIHDILTGDAAADLSHAGGEFAELLAIEDGLLGPTSQ